jgi:hypothetical protein
MVEIRVEPEDAERHTAVPAAPRAARPAGRSRWILIAALVIGFIANVVFRLWLSRIVHMPIAHTDEDSYLNTARVFAGGPGGFSSENNVLRRVGYPLLISPAFWGDPDFTTSYRLVHLLNAIYNAALFPLAYLLARTAFKVGTWRAYAIALVAATMPAAVFYSQIAMTDAVLAPLTVAWALLLYVWLRQPQRLLLAAAATAAAGAYYMVHVRGLFVLAVHAGIVALLFFRRRIKFRVAAVSAAVAILAVVGNQALILLLGHKLRLSGAVSAGGTANTIASSSGAANLLTMMGTWAWYTAAASFGLAVIGWIYAGGIVLRGKGDPSLRWTMLGLFAATGGVALACAVILSGTPSATLDLIYARYLHSFAPFWLIAGIAGVYAMGRRALLWSSTAALAVLLVGGLLVKQRMSDAIAAGHPMRYSMFGSPEFVVMLHWQRVADPLLFSALCAVVGALILVCRGRRLWVGALAIAIGANVMMMATLQHSVRSAVSRYEPTPTLASLGVRPGDKIYSTTGFPFQVRFNQAHEVTWMDVRTFRGTPPAAAEWVVGNSVPGDPASWDGSAYGFHAVGGNPQQQWILWQRN